MSDRVKEWDQYFSIHCGLPAAAIRDLFDEIERLRERESMCHERVLEQEIERLQKQCDYKDGVIDQRNAECSRQFREIERLTAALEKANYLSAEVKEAWERERISIDTFNAAIAFDDAYSEVLEGGDE